MAGGFDRIAAAVLGCIFSACKLRQPRRHLDFVGVDVVDVGVVVVVGAGRAIRRRNYLTECSS